MPPVDVRDALGVANPSVEQVVEKLQDPDWRVRYAACLWLMARPNRAHGAPVLALARSLGDESELVSRWAAYALGRIGPPAAPAIPALLEAIKSKNLTLREAAAQALANIGPPPDAEAELLAAVSLDDYRTGARKATVEALARVARSEEAVLALAGLLLDKDAQVAKAAESALASLGRQASVAVPGLIDCIEEPQGRARSAAARVLGAIGPDAGPAVPVLFGLLEDENEEVRKAAATAIRSIRRSRIAAASP